MSIIKERLKISALDELGALTIFGAMSLPMGVAEQGAQINR